MPWNAIQWGCNKSSVLRPIQLFPLQAREGSRVMFQSHYLTMALLLIHYNNMIHGQKMNCYQVNVYIIIHIHTYRNFRFPVLHYHVEEMLLCYIESWGCFSQKMSKFWLSFPIPINWLAPKDVVQRQNGRRNVAYKVVIKILIYCNTLQYAVMARLAKHWTLNQESRVRIPRGTDFFFFFFFAR